MLVERPVSFLFYLSLSLYSRTISLVIMLFVHGTLELAATKLCRENSIDFR